MVMWKMDDDRFWFQRQRRGNTGGKRGFANPKSLRKERVEVRSASNHTSLQPSARLYNVNPSAPPWPPSLSSSLGKYLTVTLNEDSILDNKWQMVSEQVEDWSQGKNEEWASSSGNTASYGHSIQFKLTKLSSLGITLFPEPLGK